MDANKNNNVASPDADDTSDDNGLNIDFRILPSHSAFDHETSNPDNTIPNNNNNGTTPDADDTSVEDPAAADPEINDMDDEINDINTNEQDEIVPNEVTDELAISPMDDMADQTTNDDNSTNNNTKMMNMNHSHVDLDDVVNMIIDDENNLKNNIIPADDIDDVDNNAQESQDDGDDQDNDPVDGDDIKMEYIEGNHQVTKQLENVNNDHDLVDVDLDDNNDIKLEQMKEDSADTEQHDNSADELDAEIAQMVGVEDPNTQNNITEVNEDNDDDNQHIEVEVNEDDKDDDVDIPNATTTSPKNGILSHLSALSPFSPKKQNEDVMVMMSEQVNNNNTNDDATEVVYGGVIEENAPEMEDDTAEDNNQKHVASAKSSAHNAEMIDIEIEHTPNDSTSQNNNNNEEAILQVENIEEINESKSDDNISKTGDSDHGKDGLHNNNNMTLSNDNINNNNNHDPQLSTASTLTVKIDDGEDNDTEDTRGSNASDSGGGIKNKIIEKMESEITDPRTRKTQVLGIFLINILVLLLFSGIYLGLFYIASDYVWTFKFMIAFIFFVVNTLYLLSTLFYFYIKEILKPNQSGVTTTRVDGCLNKIKSIWLLTDKFELIRPSMTHFGDTATDIAVLIEFFERSKWGNKTDNNNNMVDYTQLFIISLGVVVASRLVTGIVVYNHTKSITNMFLQFGDLYLFKVLYIAVRNGYEEPPPLQTYVLYLEAMFESAPQLLITLYVTLATWIFTNEPLSGTLIFCASVSLFNILNRSNDEDLLLVQNLRFRSLDFSFLCNFNLLYVLRIIWRFCDISGGILLLILFGLVTSVSTMVLYVTVLLLLYLITPALRLYVDSNLTQFLDDVLVFNVLLQTPIAHNRSRNGHVATMYGIVRILSQICLLGAIFYFDQIRGINVFVFDNQNTSEDYSELAILYIIALSMFGISLFFYIFHCIAEFNVFYCGCCKSSNKGNSMLKVASSTRNVLNEHTPDGCCNLRRFSMLTRVRVNTIERVIPQKIKEKSIKPVRLHSTASTNIGDQSVDQSADQSANQSMDQSRDQSDAKEDNNEENTQSVDQNDNKDNNQDDKEPERKVKIKIIKKYKASFGCDSVIGCGLSSMAPITLVGCKSMEDVENVMKFEYKLTMNDIRNYETWLNFNDPLMLIEFIMNQNNRKCLSKYWNDVINENGFGNFRLFKNIWKGIFMNKNLSDKGEDYWMDLLLSGGFEEFSDSKNGIKESNMLMKIIVKYQCDPLLIAMMINKYNAKCNDKLVRYADRNNKTIGKELIVTYLKSGLNEVR